MSHFTRPYEPEGQFDPGAEDLKLHNRLGVAIQHLGAFVATFNADDDVDEESGLTAADLRTLLEAANIVHRSGVDG